VLIGVLVACLVAEAALRLANGIPEVANPLYSFHEADPVLGWRGKADVRLRFRRPDFDVVIEHGSDGWRKPEPALPTDPRRRVLLLGDSFTWGWGVGQGEVFTDHLQRARPDTLIANRGANGFGTSQEYLLLQRELAATHYDAVAVMFFVNDVQDNVNPKHGRRPLFALDGERLVPRNQPPKRLINPVQRFFKDHSRAFQLVDFEISLFLRSLDDRERNLAAGFDDRTDASYDALPGSAVTQRLLGEMSALARAHGAAFFLVYLPQRSELDRIPSRHPYVRAVHALAVDTARRYDIPLIDLAPAFHVAARNGAGVVYAHDEHWTPAGHVLAADVLLASELFAAGKNQARQD
jgi:lysophospholipase L1-like esterase